MFKSCIILSPLLNGFKLKITTQELNTVWVEHCKYYGNNLNIFYFTIIDKKMLGNIYDFLKGLEISNDIYNLEIIEKFIQYLNKIGITDIKKYNQEKIIDKNYVNSILYLDSIVNKSNIPENICKICKKIFIRKKVVDIICEKCSCKRAGIRLNNLRNEKKVEIKIYRRNSGFLDKIEQDKL